MAGRRLDVLSTDFFPAYVVWELTLRCDLACRHCGSRAGPARPVELTTSEAVAVAEELGRMGAREVVLIGGEAYLHEGFLEVVEALARAGVVPVMTTGGRGVDEALARAMAEAGLRRVSVSIDGLEPTHDRMRGFRGSFAAALAALDHCAAAGLSISANTNLNRLNWGDLEALYEQHLRGRVRSWQLQITTPLGRAADRTAMIFQPFDLLELLPRVAALKRRAFAEGVLILPGNNLGYFGPEEGLLRSQTPEGTDHWQGCQAGRFVMGIESDGAVKGCPSLQTAAYVGGKVLERGLAEIWNEAPQLAFTRERSVEDLWGYCRGCVFAKTCLGGCSFTAHAVFGRPGNNPYCHYRARDFAKRGLRERLVPTEAAEGTPFDNGLFEVVEEPLDAPDPEAALEPRELVQITRRPGSTPAQTPRDPAGGGA
ncbi:heme biosynthesis protein [Plesiocystis pacifica SIR-1]|uniref:Heme biosynthesis protein n=1 Tax=Plesiocystis pacifica SIR-1 TaxID=391625 RepID=A6GDU3_9BACT|nr:radical SAM protein [Plesiocystis pacifica]EDM75982.1 heme biosynthesis protein [Plesiocystis pacifica SIR-1]